jgi:FkbH-like protein
MMAERDFGSAKDALRELWQVDPSASTAAYLLRRRDQMDLPGTEVRLAILRSFTLEPVIPFLEAEAFLEDIRPQVRICDFNTYAQELLNPESALYSFTPEVVILAVQARDLLPELWDRPGELSLEDSAVLVRRTLEQLQTWIQAFRSRSRAHLILHNFEHPAVSSAGILDAQDPEGQSARIWELNLGLMKLAREFQNLYVLDYDGLVARHGRKAWFDPLKWSTARFPLSIGSIPHLAHEWVRFLYAIAGRVRKVLVTDLDNTLWGGVAAEDGLNVRIDDTYKGIGYRNLQRALADLHNRGLLLAINSKNNPDDALAVLREHPQMILREEHFAAQRMNWHDKAQNMREIAAELNLGIDSLVFLDDNPVERERIRMELPEVQVLELPADPMEYEWVLRNNVTFERLTLSEEDRARNQLYQEQKERAGLANHAGSVEEFLHSLQQRVTIRSVRTETLGRVAQLTRKTNQFNLTTKRYSEEEISSLLSTPGWAAYSVQVEDRFGDNGIVGVAITQVRGSVCEIDTFLLSCRVIGRTVERSILAHLCAEAQERDATELRGWFLPTKKNLPAVSVYRDHGFEEATHDSGTGATLWVLDLRSKSVASPDWIDLQAETGAALATYGTN